MCVCVCVCLQDPSLFQDPSQSFRAKMGSDEEFVGGIQGKLGNMGLEYVKEMYLEQNFTHDAGLTIQEKFPRAPYVP